MVLTVTLASVKLLCGIADGSQDAGITALIALQQPALEYALDPAILANTAGDAALMATLTLGAAEVLAGSYVAILGRPQLTYQLFKISTLEVVTKPVNDLAKLGAALAATGLARLSPFSRSARALARTAAGGDANLDDQSPVPLLLGAGLGLPGPAFSTQGPPVDSTFDRVLGTDGRTEPPGADVADAPFFGAWTGGAE